MPDISIIIVSWNVAALLTACLDSIIANAGHLQLEVIVVDSASSDNTVAHIRRDYPWVTLLPQDENVGFTKGNNIGMARATGAYLLLLNPDTEIIGDMLQEIIKYMKQHPDVGIVGPHTLNTDGTTQSSRRRFPTKILALFESTWLQQLVPGSLFESYYVTDEDDRAVLDVDWVQGHALMARREIYNQIGPLDTDFVMYFEELDWCTRAKNAGWRVVYLGTAQVTHHGGQSSAQAGAYQYIQFYRSKIHYFQKYHGVAFASFLRLFLLLMFVAQLLIEGGKWLIRHKPELRRERVSIYWQVIRSRL